MGTYYYGSTVGTSSGNSALRAVLWIEPSNNGSNGYTVNPRYCCEVTKGDFQGSKVNCSWSSQITVSGTGQYNTADGGATTVDYGSSKTFSCSCTYVSRNLTSTASTDYTAPRPTYSVSYNANGGSGAPSAQSYNNGTSATISSTVPTKSGYTFLGWGTSATAKTVSYSSGSTYSGNANITLYAIWRKNVVLTFNSNGGEDAPSASSGYLYNSETTCILTVPTDAPNKTNMVFIGWSTDPNATTAQYKVGSSISLTADTTLYAVWMDGLYFPGDSFSYNNTVTLYAMWEPYTHTVVFDFNGGEGTQENFISSIETSNRLSSDIPLKQDKVFYYWCTTKDGTGTRFNLGDLYTRVQDGGTFTLYAIWRDPEILFYKNGKIKTGQFKEEEGSAISIKIDGKDTLECLEIIESSSTNILIKKDGTIYCNEFIEF